MVLSLWTFLENRWKNIVRLQWLFLFCEQEIKMTMLITKFNNNYVGFNLRKLRILVNSRQSENHKLILMCSKKMYNLISYTTFNHSSSFVVIMVAQNDHIHQHYYHSRGLIIPRKKCVRMSTKWPYPPILWLLWRIHHTKNKKKRHASTSPRRYHTSLAQCNM